MDILSKNIVIMTMIVLAAGATSLAQENLSGQVPRAQFTSAIIDREPIDSVLMLKNDIGKIYYFSELVNLKGKQVIHRWEYKGKMMAEVKFTVTSNRWRAYSSKILSPQLTGEWSVVVTDETGWPLKTSLFEYGEKTILE
ncbi:MAG: DUF2914 domain-containing protein [Gammaproteobacteria bacterium]|nr:DUF2914 domain-containing protein [Gammaproteobacteria bacterium]